MPDNITEDWTPPVSFYFLVEFQRMGGPIFSVSFKEVSGLGWEFTLDSKVDNSTSKTDVPKSLRFNHVELKYPVSDKSEAFQKWLAKCFGMFEEANDSEGAIKGKIPTYDMVIKLLDKEGTPIAAWNCYHAYPIKWSLGGLDGESSKLAMETVTMTFASIRRIQ